MSFLLFDSYIRLLISILVFITFFVYYQTKIRLTNFFLLGEILFFILEIYFIDDIVFKFLYFVDEIDNYLNPPQQQELFQQEDYNLED